LHGWGTPRSLSNKKNLGAENLKLEEILGGSQKFFGPLISKTGRHIRNIISNLEKGRHCATINKFIGKSIRRKFVKNANERGHKFSEKKLKISTPCELQNDDG